jgi:hypothetical protein
MIAGVEDGVDAVDGGRHGLGVADVALEHLKPRVRGQRGGCAVERADLMPAVEQFGHQVGAHEAGAAGDEDAAKIGGQR